MSEPWFWRGDGAAARMMRAALLPAASLYDAGQRLRRRLTAPIDAGAPVLCVGSASIGGAGKTPFAIMLQRLLAADGIDAEFLTRGYGGSLKGPVRVNARHMADEAGDEALLLAAVAPTWIAKDRAAGAAAAAAAGARLLIMDDGFQNPSVRKAVSFLLVGADDDRLAQFPAGPMREPLSVALERADAVVFSAAPGRDDFMRRERNEPSPWRQGAAAFAVRADITPSIPPQRVVAFCGIGRPERFFDSLTRAGFALAARAAFADHHRYDPAEIAALRARAGRETAALITTEKDFVRLPPEDRAGIAVAHLALRADDPDGLVRFVRERIKR